MYEWTPVNLYGAKDAHTSKIKVAANGESLLTLFAYYQLSQRRYVFQVNYKNGLNGTFKLVTGRGKSISAVKDAAMIAAVRLKRIFEENA